MYILLKSSIDFLKKGILFILFMATPVFAQQHSQELKVLQFNIWQEGTMVPGGFDAIIEEILRSEADLIALSEVRNYKDEILAEKLVKALAEEGHTFYSKKSEDSGILSRYPIISQEAIFPLKNDQGSVYKAIINVEGKKIAFYTGHLDYRHCSIYLPRGYDGSTWKKLDSAITDPKVIAADNLESKRDEAIDALIADAQKQREKNRLVIFGTDLNEASHLDWIEATKNLFDHNGVAMPWRNTSELEKAGFKDAYREIYPNPVTHPGFTFPADNKLVEIDKLAWAPEADDRDRIDYIFYRPSKKLKLKSVKIIGPKGSIIKNQRKPERTEDPIDSPPGVWPSDHKAVLAVFELR
ncbi:Exonuclease III [Salegentibacter echinorum]|uniref:Exonuclease III n=1 Tax=Salegentibacter echinorum TaxID=1073325 RepID=A0A1M5HZF0_SALEC|nr:endonuclease/exonuclease/phosphatase family protein [Salegentibacter echinorum]SHG21388.1 Exonuclease III [Salegentibacter echinorum]